MSHAGGPYGSDAPPPPPPGQGAGGGYGGYPGPAGGPGEAGYGPPGDGGYGPPGGGYPPHVDGYGEQPPKKRNTLLIGALIGGALLLLLCCGGVVALGMMGSSGFDEAPGETTSATSEPSESPTSSETPTQSETPTSSASPSESEGSASEGEDLGFPDEFDGWQRSDQQASAPQGSQGAIYTKDDKAIVVVATDDAPGAMDGFKMVWSDDKDVDGGVCGKIVSQTQCAATDDGTIFILNDTDGGDFEQVMGTLQAFLDAR
ncbi:hypothetical protein GCM10022199_03280 [Marihabitans asiaticum]|uniref:Uncharacterized protein n=1 Tax=Marihabitans asiaticum TaxID=415218 RepID=A0A560WEE1_9MICO|nr:hypothetical protein [Marihabitans asiaticum]TWD15998.1 hypothetical protein FB557_1539 [Marihabitans asiaticum]